MSTTTTLPPADAPRAPTGMLARVVEVFFESVNSELTEAESELREVLAELRQTNPSFVTALEAEAAARVAMSATARQMRPGVLEALLAQGWYPGPWLTDPVVVDLSELLRGGKVDEVDNRMTGLARDQLERIRVEVCDAFSGRAPILAEAFAAHAERRFALSIPALLAQADGVGCEVMGLGRAFYARTRRDSVLTAKLNEFILAPVGMSFFDDTSFDSLLRPLRLTWAIAEDTAERDGRSVDGCGQRPLNRHGVLHGVDTDYPSEANSLRCILLVGYLLEVRRALHEVMPSEFAKVNSLLAEKVTGWSGDGRAG